MIWLLAAVWSFLFFATMSGILAVGATVTPTPAQARMWASLNRPLNKDLTEQETSRMVRVMRNGADVTPTPAEARIEVQTGRALLPTGSTLSERL